MYKNIAKPILDFIVASIAFIVLLPVFCILTILLFLISGRNPFFLQKRPGKEERIFKIIKFRTMSGTSDEFGELLPDAQRITRLGKFIRSVSLDEIPQLLNVIKGDMSLVGPRPLLPQYLEFYDEFQKKRHFVRPGITGYAQVNGRNAINWEKKLEFDIWYVENMNFVLDIKIIFLTLKKVISSEGVTAKDHASMPGFVEYIKEKRKSNL